MPGSYHTPSNTWSRVAALARERGRTTTHINQSAAETRAKTSCNGLMPKRRSSATSASFFSNGSVTVVAIGSISNPMMISGEPESLRYEWGHCTPQGTDQYRRSGTYDPYEFFPQFALQ